MSFRSLGKLFKTNKKTDKLDSKEISLPIEGFEKCITMLLAHCGREVSELYSSESKEGSPSTRDKCNIHGVAVLRCLGRSHALAGADPFEDLEIDQIVDVFTDFLHKVLALDIEEDPERALKISTFSENVATPYLTKLDAVVANNRGHLALNKLTWADFLLAGMWDHVKEILDIDSIKFQNIETLVLQVTSLPCVKLTLNRTDMQRNLE